MRTTSKLGLAVALLVPLLAVAASACSDRTVEEQPDVEALCAIHCENYMGSCGPDEKEFSSSSECQGACVGDETSWNGCAKEYESYLACLDTLTCDDYFAYYVGEPHDCEDQQHVFSACLARAGKDRE